MNLNLIWYIYIYIKYLNGCYKRLDIEFDRIIYDNKVNLNIFKIV